MTGKDKMLSLFFRNLLFTILQPGIIAGLIPFWMVRTKLTNIFEQPLNLYQYLGIVVFVTGITILSICIVSFAVQGRGTLSPVDPTKKLVVAGLYKFSRNPMYVGVTMILMGEAMLFQSIPLWIYTCSIFTVFNIFIIFFEEQRLKKDFQGEYYEYCKKVNRWI